MTQLATTIEQSKKLIELGIDVNTADMHYNKWDNDEEEEYYLECGRLPKIDFKYVTNIPAWSLSALLELLSYCDTLYMRKMAKDDGYLWISVTQSLPNNPLIRDSKIYQSMIDMVLDKYIYPYLNQKLIL